MSSRPKARPSVLVALRDKAAFLEQYFPGGDGHGGILVPGNLHYTPGDLVVLELNFLSEQKTFRIRGRVTWTRDEESLLPPAMCAEFLEGERPTRDLVLDFVRGKDVRFKERSDHRFPVSLQIAYKTDAAFITDWTDDLSQGGAFIVTERSIPLGTIMPLRIKVPGSLLPLKLRGVVCWTRSGAGAGVGVKFLFESERQRRRVQALVAEMKSEIIQQMQGRARARTASKPPVTTT